MKCCQRISVCFVINLRQCECDLLQSDLISNLKVWFRRMFNRVLWPCKHDITMHATSVRETYHGSPNIDARINSASKRMKYKQDGHALQLCCTVSLCSELAQLKTVAGIIKGTANCLHVTSVVAKYTRFAYCN